MTDARDVPGVIVSQGAVRGLYPAPMIDTSTIRRGYEAWDPTRGRSRAPMIDTSTIRLGYEARGVSRMNSSRSRCLQPAE